MSENKLINSRQISLRLKEALFRTAVWSFIGVLYGILFNLTYSLSTHFAAGFFPILIAGSLAGCIGALIYSSMSLAAIVTPLSAVAAIITVITQGQSMDLAMLLLVTGLVGAVAGAIYGFKVKESRVYRADAKTIAGFLAGGSVALGFALLYLIFPGFPLYLAIAIMCLLTGSLYVLFAPFCVKHFNHLLPPIADGAIAGGATSMFVGLVLFIMVTGVTPESAGDLGPVANRIRELMPVAMLGGLLGGGIAGFMSAMMRREWLDL